VIRNVSEPRMDRTRYLQYNLKINQHYVRYVKQCKCKLNKTYEDVREKFKKQLNDKKTNGREG
jgi:hypothetical protein